MTTPPPIQDPLVVAQSRRILHALKDLELSARHFHIKYLDQEIASLRKACEELIARVTAP